MKKLLIIALSALTLTACVSGSKREIETEGEYSEMFYTFSNIVYTFQDPETGVWYIMTNRGGIMPRLNSDGTIYITDGKN